MATYVLPQVQVFQDFQDTVATAANQLNAHLSGGDAVLTRYADEDERQDGYVGYYDPAIDSDYLWPNRPAGAVIDPDYTKVWIKDALLHYFADSLSGGSTITKVAGYGNRVRSDSVNFKSNGSFARAASLLDRDVSPGDAARLRVQPQGGDPEYMWTYIKDIVADETDATVGAPTADDENIETQVESAVVVKTTGAANCMTLEADLTDYNGLEDGYINDTYVLKVIGSSIGGDLTTAKLRLISGSGLDDVIEFSPAAVDTPFEVGSRGLSLEFGVSTDPACATAATDAGVSSDDLIEGQEWAIAANQEWVASALTVTGDFTGQNDTTYIVEVVAGGYFADTVKPQIRVTTTNGEDMSGPTSITGAGVEVPIGTQGIRGSFSATGLRLGDRFYVEITGIQDGPMRTIVLGNSLPLDVPDDSEVGLDLYIRKPLLQVTENRDGYAPLVNWEQSETEITVKSGIIAYDASWTDQGNLQGLPVVSESSMEFGQVFVEYRAWLPTLSYDVHSIGDVGELDDVFVGPLHPDNPLKWGAFKALSNSNGTPVKVTAVRNPADVDAWVSVLELLLGRDDVYNLVPLTRNREVQDLFAAHVDSMSSAENGLWRVAWFNLQGIPEVPVIHNGSDVPGYTEGTTDNDQIAMGTFIDDPLTADSQYTILQVPNNNVNFITNEVRPGDVVRALYVGDGFGGSTYSEFIVDEVQAEDRLRLQTGPNAPQTVPAKFEIWRNLTATEEALEIAKDAGAWNNRRIRAIWPDQIESGGTVQEGYHLAAALAGLSSGILPHQGMTRLEIAGFSDVPRTISKFNRPQLDTMAVAGVWIVTQDSFDGKIFSRHAVTTGDYELINEREEMGTRNYDSISYRFRDQFEPYLGVSNVTPSMQSVLESDFEQIVLTLQTEKFTEQLGGQLIEAELTELREHYTLADRYVMVVVAQGPRPFNSMEIHLVI